MRLFLLFLLVCALPCHAGKLFACRDADGRMSFVDHGCPGARDRHEVILPAAVATAKSLSDADAKQIAAWEKASNARLPASLGGTTRSGTGTVGRDRNPRRARDDACSTARAAQTKAERERSFQTGFDERRRLSDAVLSACGLR